MILFKALEIQVANRKPIPGLLPFKYGLLK